MPDALGPGASLRQQRDWWHVRFYDPDRSPSRTQQSLRTTDKSIALERARDLYREWEYGAFDPWTDKYRSASVRELLRQYRSDREGQIVDRSIDVVVYPVKQFLEWAKYPEDVSIRQIDPQDLTAFLARPSLSQGGKASNYRKISVFFNWAVEEGYLDESPLSEIDAPTMPSRVPKYYTADQLERFLRAVQTAWEKRKKYTPQDLTHPLWPRDVYAVAGYTGLRRGELRRLNWEDVRWPVRHNGAVVEPGTITVRGETKTKTERIVTMIPQAERWLRRLCEWRVSEEGSEAVLKNHTRRERASTTYASRKFAGYANEAGLPNITFHGLRHTFAAICRLKGMPIHQLQAELGHAEIEQTLRYGAIGPAHRTLRTYELFEESDEKDPQWEHSGNGHI